MIEIKSRKNVKIRVRGKDQNIEVEVSVAAADAESGRMVEFAVSECVDSLQGKSVL